jgi:hypothetical protein
LDAEGKGLPVIRERGEILRADRAGIAGEQRREAGFGRGKIRRVDPHQEVEVALRQASRNGGRAHVPDVGRGRQRGAKRTPDAGVERFRRGRRALGFRDQPKVIRVRNPDLPAIGTGAAGPYSMPSLAFSRAFTAAGLALPPVAFMVWPTNQPSRVGFSFA